MLSRSVHLLSHCFLLARYTAHLLQIGRSLIGHSDPSWKSSCHRCWRCRTERHCDCEYRYRRFSFTIMCNNPSRQEGWVPSFAGLIRAPQPESKFSLSEQNSSRCPSRRKVVAVVGMPKLCLRNSSKRKWHCSWNNARTWTSLSRR
jgi:hypothetical protein